MWNYLLFSENESQLDRLKRNQYNFNIILKFFVDQENFDSWLKQKNFYLYKKIFSKIDRSKINFELERRFFLSFIHPYIVWRKITNKRWDKIYELWYFNGLSFFILNDYFIKIDSLFWWAFCEWTYVSDINYNHPYVLLKKKFSILWNFIYNFNDLKKSPYFRKEDINYLIQRYDSYFYMIYSMFDYFDKKWNEYQNISDKKVIYEFLYEMLIEYNLRWFKSFFEDFKKEYSAFQSLENTTKYRRSNFFEKVIKWSYKEEDHKLKVLLKSKNNFLKDKWSYFDEHFLSLYWLLLWNKAKRWNSYMFDINEYHQYLKEILDNFESFNFEFSEKNIFTLLYWYSNYFKFDHIFDLKTLQVENIKKASEYHEEIVSKIFEKYNERLERYFSLDVLKLYSNSIVNAYKNRDFLRNVWISREYELDVFNQGMAFEKWLQIFASNSPTNYSWKFQYLLSYIFDLFFYFQDFLILVKQLLLFNKDDINNYLKIKFSALNDFSFLAYFSRVTWSIIEYCSYNNFDFDQKEEYKTIVKYLKERIYSLQKDISLSLIWKNWSNL